MMRNWYRVRLGREADQTAACIAGNYVGIDYGVEPDLSHALSSDREAFDRWFVPTFMSSHPDRSRVSAGVVGAIIWTFAKTMQTGDAILCPVGNGQARMATITGNYYHQPGQQLPHRRPVAWFGPPVEVAGVSSELKAAVDPQRAVVNLSAYAAELEALAAADEQTSPGVDGQATLVADPMAFALESHLQAFLVHNWAKTPLGHDCDIYAEDGDPIGVHYPSATGPLDILAISKDRRTLLVVELKKGRSSDAVVGQTLRYMGYVQEQLAEPGQQVRGAIIAPDANPRLTWALRAAPNVQLYRYQVDFTLA